MTIDVCILEDEEPYSRALEELLQEWQAANSADLSVSVCRSGEELLSLDYCRFSVLFLDIRLGDTDGISLAHRLRREGYAGELVFLTAYQEYVFEGYNVHALNYYLKPISYEQLDSCMQYVKRRQSAAYFVCRHYGNITKIPYRDILYFSSRNQYTEVHTSDGSIYRQAIPLKHVISTLPAEFIQCHRTLAVNIDHVEKLDGATVFVTGGEQLPVSKKYLDRVRERFLESLL